MEPHFSLDDTAFEQQFRELTLSPDLFSHEAHIRLAWIHIKKYGEKKAITNITSQLLNFVNHLGATDKYNLTLTIAAIKIVKHFFDKKKNNSFEEFIYEFPQLKNNFKGLIAQHYTLDIYHSEKAKKEFITPDVLHFS